MILRPTLCFTQVQKTMQVQLVFWSFFVGVGLFVSTLYYFTVKIMVTCRIKYCSKSLVYLTEHFNLKKKSIIDKRGLVKTKRQKETFLVLETRITSEGGSTLSNCGEKHLGF